MVDQEDADLSAIAGVDGAGCVQHGDAVAEGEPAARPYLALGARRQLDGETGADEPGLAGRNVDVDGREQIEAGVTGVRPRGQAGAGRIETLDGEPHDRGVDSGRAIAST